MRTVGLLQILLLSFQLMLPGLHLCLGGECAGEAGLHGPHESHLHERESAPCLESADPHCADLYFAELDEPRQPATTRFLLKLPPPRPIAWATLTSGSAALKAPARAATRDRLSDLDLLILKETILRV